MEKLVYVVWKPEGRSEEEFKGDVLGSLVERLGLSGAERISVNLTDADTLGHALRITQMEEPMTGTVSFWLDTHLDRGEAEAAIQAATGRMHGYLVLESMPLVNRTHTVAPWERTPGLVTVAFLEKPEAMTYEAWREQWQGSHTRVAIDTQSSFLYIQNVVVRALTADAPAWTAIVEEAFPAAAAEDQSVFYDAGDSDEKLKENQRLMIESCSKFIDFTQLESHPFSAYFGPR